MQTYSNEHIMNQNGTITINNLPFNAGEKISVVIVSKAKTHKAKKRYPFWNKPIKYIDPTEPVALDDWEIYST
ncbi:conserved hypothetical protein [Desulfamplus magnetovallimortis]|uniref:Uncharacterized protein n=1 Tax=Desulfamplus magnetovallimortis TaxID=1246637 RepID=A0A1W1HBQ3_9BACT|nr:hypothetical protein [Desulfamplus magnetovallimortis]SLM29869.1 conserved hypothetical protein [Desulfamplus magnetovallimortis]